jgi:FAD/FMN-containing dehydrogenase
MGTDTVLIAVRFPGVEEEVTRAERDGEAILRARGTQGVLAARSEEQYVFWNAATDFTHLEMPAGEALVRVAAPPPEIGLVPPMADLQAREHGLALTWLVDALTGVAWLRFRAPERARPASLGRALGDIQAALVARWRTSVVLACEPALKAQLAVWGAEPAGIGQMREIKEALDPTHLLNPGRFLTGL